MFFLLSKSISFFIKPLGILFTMVLIQYFIKNHTKRKRLNILILVLLYIFSCPAIVNVVISKWEMPFQSIEKIAPKEFGVLLTGGLVNESQSIGSKIHLGNQADRIWQTAELYRHKKIEKVLISGGDGFNRIEPDYIYENDKAKAFLIQNGVPEKDIIQDKNAVNTYENAKNSKDFFLKTNTKPNIILITSGFHMRRAEACFTKQNFICLPFCTTPMTGNYDISLIDFIPKVQSFLEFDLIVNEWIGMLVYRALGYI